MWGQNIQANACGFAVHRGTMTDTRRWRPLFRTSAGASALASFGRAVFDDFRWRCLESSPVRMRAFGGLFIHPDTLAERALVPVGLADASIAADASAAASASSSCKRQQQATVDQRPKETAPVMCLCCDATRQQATRNQGIDTDTHEDPREIKGSKIRQVILE